MNCEETTCFYIFLILLYDHSFNRPTRKQKKAKLWITKYVDNILKRILNTYSLLWLCELKLIFKFLLQIVFTE